MNRESKKEIILAAIEEYLSTPELERSLTKIGRKWGVKRQTISKYLKDRGYEVINYQNRCRIDENVFDTIDTEEKAYWLGFIWADGNISSEGHRFEINLSIKDIDHMKKLKDFLKLESDIRIDTSRGEGFYICRMSVRNKNLWEQLNNKGCTPCKSLTVKFPNKSIFSNEKLIRDFIRGYCDGDGSLSLCTNRGKLKTTVNFVGTEATLIGIRNYFGIYGNIRNKSTKNYNNQAYSLNYTDLKARQVARIMYENSTIYLERKYNKFLEFCRLEEESSRRRSSKIGESWDANTEVTN